MTKLRETAARLVLLGLAAGLPLVLSFTMTAEPLAPKQALWLMGCGLCIALPGPLSLGLSGPPVVLLALAAIGILVLRPVTPDLTPYLVGAVLWLRARETAGKPGFLRKYIILTVFTAAVVSVNAVSQAVWNRIFTDLKLVNPFGARVLSTLGNPTFLADYLALHLPLALTLAAESAGKAAFSWWGLCAAAIAAAIVLTGSKGGLIAASVAVTGWLYLAVRKRLLPAPRLVLLTAFLALSVGVLTVASGSPSLVLNRWTSSTERFSFRQRAAILRGSFVLLAESPVLGRGAGGYPAEIPRHQPLELNRSIGITLSVNHAHNDYAEIACDLGLAGLGLGLLIPLLAWRWRRQGLKLGLGLSLGCSALSMATNFFIFLPSSAFFFWFHAGLLSGKNGGGPLANEGKSTAVHDSKRIVRPALPATVCWLLTALFCLAAGRHLLSTGWFTAGQTAVDRGDFAAAPPALTKAAALSPSNRHVWQYIGRAYELRSDWGPAETAYQRARALGPHHAITMLNIARVLRSRGLASNDPGIRRRAIGIFREVVRANPYQVDARVWGAEMAVAAGMIDSAAVFLDDYPADLPFTPEWHRARAKWLASRGDGPGSRREAENALKLETAAMLAAAEEAFGSGRAAAAIAKVRTVLKKQPLNKTAWENLGYYLHSTGRLAEAKSCYERVIALTPGSLPVRLNLAYISMQEKNLNQAGRHVGAALKAAPDSIEAHLATARLCALKRDRPGAAVEYRWILEREPGNAIARAELQKVSP
jgi:Flp pilus assembly protein TadD/O-antigen ligase